MLTRLYYGISGLLSCTLAAWIIKVALPVSVALTDHIIYAAILAVLLLTGVVGLVWACERHIRPIPIPTHFD